MTLRRLNAKFARSFSSHSTLLESTLPHISLQLWRAHRSGLLLPARSPDKGVPALPLLRRDLLSPCFGRRRFGIARPLRQHHHCAVDWFPLESSVLTQSCRHTLLLTTPPSPLLLSPTQITSMTGMEIEAQTRASWRAPLRSLPESSQQSGRDGSSVPAKREPQRTDRAGARARANTAGEAISIERVADTEPPTQPKKRNRRRRTKPAPGNKKLATKDPQLHQLLETLIRLCLMNQQELRNITGFLYDTAFVKDDSPIATTMLQEIRSFTAEAAKRRSEAEAAGDTSRPTPLGPPHRCLALALLEGILASDCGGANKTRVAEIHKTWSEAASDDQSKLDDFIHTCRLSKAGAPGTTRITIALPKGTDRSTILTALRAIENTDLKSGPPPAGWLEEELSDWLTVLAPSWRRKRFASSSRGRLTAPSVSARSSAALLPVTLFCAGFR